jgi:hypothetical protein
MEQEHLIIFVYFWIYEIPDAHANGKEDYTLLFRHRLCMSSFVINCYVKNLLDTLVEFVFSRLALISETQS